MLEDLCERLAQLARVRPESAWPSESLELCAANDVFRWFVDREHGGLEWSSSQIADGYLELAAACLTTTFIITQRTAATRRIASSNNHAFRKRWLPLLADGTVFATVGISQLTTSRQHVAPPLVAERQDGGWSLRGLSPWVTGGGQADLIVMGAATSNDQQLLFGIERRDFRVETPHQLMALTGSSTGAVHLDGIIVPDNNIIAGPMDNVMNAGTGGGSGGLQTSTLAIGLSLAAVRFLASEVKNRPDLAPMLEELQSQIDDARRDLMSLCGDGYASEGPAVCTPEDLRTRANSLVLRATQSALAAAKGAGYVQGHPVGRWCREALFFLVWSCPRQVLRANLCEFAGMGFD